jgi:putative NIF3 family GTP cyclohydrolase 1 type 2
MLAKEVLDFVAGKFEIPLKDFPDGGFKIGSGNDKVSGVLMTWLATADALHTAADKGLNLVICHESFGWDEREELWPYRASGPYRKPFAWPHHPDIRLREIAVKNGLTVLHIHYGLDRAYIFDEFFKALGITNAVSGDIYEKIYSLPSPMRFGELVEQVGEKIKTPMMRFIGDENRIIKLAGNCWGGVGLSCNRYFTRRLFEDGADVVICGELDEMAFFFAKECGGCLIETSHVLSENIGIGKFADDISRNFGMPVHFYEVEIPYKIKTFHSNLPH